MKEDLMNIDDFVLCNFIDQIPIDEIIREYISLIKNHNKRKIDNLNKIDFKNYEEISSLLYDIEGLEAYETLYTYPLRLICRLKYLFEISDINKKYNIDEIKIKVAAERYK